MHSIINSDQLRTLLNDTFRIMAGQPWIQTVDDKTQVISLPRGKVEALYRLERGQWVFVPLVRTQKKGAKVIEHGFEVHREEKGWQVLTAALEVNGPTSARIKSEAARNLVVQQELEKMRLKVSVAAAAPTVSTAVNVANEPPVVAPVDSSVPASVSLMSEI